MDQALLPAMPAGVSVGARHRRWMARVTLRYLLPTLVVLALLGQIDALWRMPVEFGAAREALPVIAPGDATLGGIAGIAMGMIVVAWRARRGAQPIGGTGGLIPRSRAELPWGAAVALTAGVVEEPFFRLLVPLLVVLAGGGVLAGFALSTLLFAGAHRRQGWRGMAASGALGTALVALYLMSGALWLVVALHALVDVSALVVWPALSSGKVQGKITPRR